VKKSRKVIEFAAAITLVTTAVAVPTVAKSQVAGLTGTQQENLKSLGIKVVVPRYIPSGFRVVKVKTEPCRSGACRAGQPGYTITYQSSKKACFDVEGTSGGLGGPGLEDAISVKSKLFGSTQVGFFRVPGSSERGMAESTHLSSDWLTLSPASGPFYRLYSRAWKPAGCTSRITPQEAVKIVEFLGWLS
jgi:hypothetical protein